MTIYFVGTELQDFPIRVGSAAHNTTTNNRRTANTRASIQCVGAAQYANRIGGPVGASEFWMHIVQGFAAGYSGTAYPFLSLRSGDTDRLCLRYPYPDQAIYPFTLQRFDSPDYTSIVSSAPVEFEMKSNYQVLDLYVKLGNPGTFRLYRNNIPWIGQTDLNLSFSGVTEIDEFWLANCNVGNGTMYYSEIIVSDFCTLNSKVVSRVPDANGTHQDFAGGTYTQVDEITADSAFLTTDTVDDRVSVSLTDFPSLGTNEQIEVVKSTAVLARSWTGPSKANIFSRVDGVDYDSSDQSVPVSLDGISNQWELSPDTGVRWTPSEINSSEFGIRART